MTGRWRAELALTDAIVANTAALAKSKPKQDLTSSISTSTDADHPGFTFPLLYQHPHIQFQHKLAHRGGGRGYFATRDIPPGELILAEEPGCDIPAYPEERDPSERCLLNLAALPDSTVEYSRIFLSNLALLHPQSLAEISTDRLQDLKQNYAQLLREMQTLPQGKALGLADESTLLRHVAALHFNGFTTGVYLFLAMVNHSCAPNCIKWGARDGVEHSEVRSTRLIRAGEEITFSYLVPLVRSSHARQRALQGQFGFDCLCDLCEPGTCPGELESGTVEAKHELELVLEQVESLQELEKDAKLVFTKVCRARNEARMRGGLGPRSLALAHADVIIIEACLILLEDGANSSPKDMHFYILALLTKALSVRKTQRVLFLACGGGGQEDDVLDTNCESETTLQHVSSALGYFLNQMGPGGVQVLTSLKLDGQQQPLFQSKLEAVQCQNACFKLSKAIAALYSSSMLPS